MKLKKAICLMAALVLVLAMAVACAAPEASVPVESSEPAAPSETVSVQPEASAETSEPAEKTPMRLAALKGPTGMGMSKLTADAGAGATANDYDIQLAAAAEDITALLLNGEVDAAAVPTNLAAVLYQKTGGAIQVAALNTLGVLYVLEKGESIQSFADLKGKTIAAAGQGATPEYVMNYLLEANGLAGEVQVEYYSEHSEVNTLMASGEADVILVPEPFVTAALSKIEGARIALNITEEWAKVTGGASDMTMGCLVVRREYAEQNQKAFDTFLEEYAASAAYVNENPAEAAELIAAQGIMAEAALAEKAIPNCNIVCVTGEEMKISMRAFLQVLFDAEPKSVGGALPEDDFYYGV